MLTNTEFGYEQTVHELAALQKQLNLDYSFIEMLDLILVVPNTALYRGFRVLSDYYVSLNHELALLSLIKIRNQTNKFKILFNSRKSHLDQYLLIYKDKGPFL